MDTHIDIYCERLDGSFWAEPINAVTNGAFIVAAILAARLAMTKQTGGAVPVDTIFLSLMIGVIGVGSFLFHTFATPWSLMADVVPIFIYKLSFLALYARRVMNLSPLRVCMLMLGFIMLGYSTYALPKEWLNGSLSYAPALIFLLGYATYHYLTHKVERSLLFIAAGVFIVSLTFRSIDMAVCETLPIGVHYMWHVLNAVVLYLTTRAYILNRPV